MEIVHDSPYLTQLHERLEKYKYEIDLLEGNYLITSRWKKPRPLLTYLFVFAGIIRLIANRTTALISFGMALLFYIDFRARLNVFNLGNSNVSSIQIGEESIHVNYSEREPMDFRKENIKSIYAQYDVDGKYYLGSIILEDNLNIRYPLLTLIGKKEPDIQILNEELLKIFQSVLLFSK